jgi:hypothetical protein
VPTFWYCIEKAEFPYLVPFRTPLRDLDDRSRSRIAELCAQEYHQEHGGRSKRWPIVVELREQPGGSTISRHVVERESAPIFVARNMSAA